MGQLHCGGCSHAARLPQKVLCIAAGQDLPGCGDPGAGAEAGGPPSLARKGLNIWAESAHDLLRALPFELDADMEHLVAPAAEESAACAGGGPFEPPDFARDVGVRCEAVVDGTPGRGAGPPAGGAGALNQDNYACVQVDEPANPWGLYAVSDGHGPEGHLLSTLLVHELPGLLAMNPGLHRHASMALHQALVAVGEMACSCQLLDAGGSGGTLSAALLRPGLLHVAWVGGSKVVLGRSCSLSEAEVGEPAAAIWNRHSGKLDARPLPPQAGGGPCGPPQRLRAVELTAENLAAEAAAATDAADGAGGPAPAQAGRRAGPGQARPQRCFGSLSLREPGAGDVGGGAPLSCEPEVRRMRLRPEDLFVVLGTAGLWGRLDPQEAVAIVGQNLHRMASDAAAALHAEAARRAALAGPGKPLDDITAVVVYLAGGRLVTDFSPWRASHVPEHSREALAARHGQTISGCPAGIWCSDSARPPVQITAC